MRHVGHGRHRRRPLLIRKRPRHSVTITRQRKGPVARPVPFGMGCPQNTQMHTGKGFRVQGSGERPAPASVVLGRKPNPRLNLLALNTGTGTGTPRRSPLIPDS
jgi:hypothetical protein